MKNLHYPLLAALLAIASCGKKEVQKEVKEIAKGVKVETIQRTEVEQIETFTATAQPLKKNVISPQSPNRIKNLYVEIGDVVRKGQKIADMDQTQLISTKTQLENNEQDLKRMQEMLAVGGASKQQVDQLKMQVDVQRTTLAQLSENVTLISPIDGVITTRGYDAGDMTNGQTPVVTVMQITPIKLIVNVGERFYAQVKTGQKATVSTELYPGVTFDGRVTLIYPTIDETTRTFGVEVQVPNADKRLRPGMYTRTELQFNKAERAVVPDRAVIKQAGSNERHVFIVEDGKAKYVTITLGRRLGDKYEVITGLTGNETVVIEGNTRLVDGDKISIKQ